MSISIFLCKRGPKDPAAKERREDRRRCEALLQVHALGAEDRKRILAWKAVLDRDEKIPGSARERIGQLIVELGVDMAAGVVKTRIAGPMFKALPMKPPTRR